MELAVSNEDTQILLKDKNVLHESVLDKYRLAGQLTQTALQYIKKLINDSYHLQTINKLSTTELCILADSYLEGAIKGGYKGVNERGIAIPTAIEVNEIANGFSAELDDTLAENLLYFSPGDIVKITMGCHIDGYTSQVTHTMVIYPPGQAPTGPLLGGKADAVCAAHIATETVTSLLGLALTPEKMPVALKNKNNGSNVVTGSLIRNIVDTIADTYHCIVVPGSRVRRVRRFLAGQAEGVVAEREYKGVVWTEADQELRLLQKSGSSSNELVAVDQSLKRTGVNQLSAVPSDEFVVEAGEVYIVDLKFAPLEDINEVGVVTLKTIDTFTGKSHNKENDIVARPNVYIRDFAQSHILKMKTSRQVLHAIDSKRSVYPFKLSFLSDSFPIDIATLEDANKAGPALQAVKKDLARSRLGMAEITNNYLAFNKPIQVVKFLPFHHILNTANPTGAAGYDAENPTLPGLELPLPRLNISALKLKSLLRNAITLPCVREMTTVALCESNAVGKPEVLRLTGGSKLSKPSYVHSKYQLNGDNELVQGIFQLAELSKDKRFGILIREVQPMKRSVGSGFTAAEDVMME